MKPKEQKNPNENGGGKRSDKTHRYSARRSSFGNKGQQSDANKANKNDSSEKQKKASSQEVEVKEEEKVATPPESSTQEENTESVSQEAQMMLEIEKNQAIEAETAAKERIASRKAVRQKNLAAYELRPDESFFKKLDSSMKKNTSFVKKLKSITEQQRDTLENEFKGLNLTKYIQEAVNSIVDAKIKVADVGCVAHLCSLFHQRYNEFTPLLKRLVDKSFENISCKDEEKGANVPRLRTSLRLLAELILDGVFANIDEGVQLLQSIFATIVNSDKTEHVYAPVILTFLRHCGEDVMGILPRKQRMWAEKFDIQFPECDIIPESKKILFKEMFKDYYDSMAKHLTKEHKALQNRERQNRQTIGLKGELPADRKEAFEKAQKSYEKLLTNTTSVAEMLNEEVPDLPEDQLEEKDETGTVNIFTPVRGNEYDVENGLWEDEDTRTFYENLKDLKSFVPQILFKEKETKPSKDNRKDPKKKRKLRNDPKQIQNKKTKTKARKIRKGSCCIGVLIELN